MFTPTALGHRTGSPVRERPARLWDVVDDAERYLDEQGLDRPHLAGNSMGGFVALELARRGRAETVCALSPGGFWSSGDGFQARAFNRLQRGVVLGHMARPILPLIYKTATLRRIVLRDVAWRADRLTAARALEIIDDGIECEILADLCAAEWQIARLDPTTMPDHHRVGKQRETPSSRRTRQD